jgi:hypothetical protein
MQKNFSHKKILNFSQKAPKFQKLTLKSVERYVFIKKITLILPNCKIIKNTPLLYFNLNKINM